MGCGGEGLLTGHCPCSFKSKRYSRALKSATASCDSPSIIRLVPTGYSARIPEDEPERLAALRRVEILDTASEEFFDSIARLVAELCGAPISLVTFVDADRQWLKSRVGLNVCETRRDVAFCAHAILQPELFVVPDALADPRFANNPLVTGEPYIRFYAGAPITTGDGHRLGTVCVIDRQPRTLNPTQETMLKVLSDRAAAELDRRARTPVAQQRRSAAALWQSKKRFFRGAVTLQSLYSKAPVGLSFLDTELRFVHVNEWFASITGHPAATFQGRTPAQILPALAARLEPLCHDVLRAGEEISEMELGAMLVSEGKSARDLQVSLSPLRSPNGRMLGISWVMQDITERKRFEKDLRRSEEQRGLILDRSEDAFIAIDVDGRITDWNARAEAIFGWVRNEVMGRSMAETIIPPRGRPACMNGLRRFLATGNGPLLKRHIEVTALHRSGHEFPVSINLTPIRLEGSWFFSAFLHDFAEPKSSRRQWEDHPLKLGAVDTGSTALADIDGLTGLKNRASFHRYLDEIFDKAQGHDSPLSVIKLDIDHFNQYTDQFGHPAGDKLLKTLALLLFKKARSYDFVARYERDDFAIILPRTDSHGAVIMSDRFRRSIGHMFGSKAITVSCGIATATAATPSAEALLKEADRALSGAKRQGRDRVVHASTLSRA